MPIYLRPAAPEKDFEAVAQLLSADQREPVSAEELLEEEAAALPRRITRHMVAEDEAGRIVGYSFAGYYPSSPPGRFYVNVAVDPDRRRQGLGAHLAGELLTWLQAQQANELVCELWEGNHAGLAFAQRYGFTVSSQLLRFTLALATFQEQKFAHLPSLLEDMGVRLTSFAHVPRTEENIRKLYKINGVATLDDPASDGAYIGYENWLKMVLESSWFQPEGQRLALVGDAFVGLCAVTCDPESGSAHGLVAGVERDYRNRKIMQALCLQAVQYARSRGGREIHGEVAADNHPMLAILRKCGARLEPGRLELRMQLPVGTETTSA